MSGCAGTNLFGCFQHISLHVVLYHTNPADLSRNLVLTVFSLRFIYSGFFVRTDMKVDGTGVTACYATPCACLICKAQVWCVLFFRRLLP